MSLRLREGINRPDYSARWGLGLSADGICALSKLELIEDDGIQTRVTGKGRLVLNAVIAALADAN
jgi:coproporphyrinogen III oxidase-like Fe-S oxidoreductase